MLSQGSEGGCSLSRRGEGLSIDKELQEASLHTCALLIGGKCIFFRLSLGVQLSTSDGTRDSFKRRKRVFQDFPFLSVLCSK